MLMRCTPAVMHELHEEQKALTIHSRQKNWPECHTQSPEMRNIERLGSACFFCFPALLRKLGGPFLYDEFVNLGQDCLRPYPWTTHFFVASVLQWHEEIIDVVELSIFFQIQPQSKASWNVWNQNRKVFCIFAHFCTVQACLQAVFKPNRAQEKPSQIFKKLAPISTLQVLKVRRWTRETICSRLPSGEKRSEESSKHFN